METETCKKPYKIKDVTRNVKKAVVASTLGEMKIKSAKKFNKTDLPNIHLDSDGTEIDDEDYFQTLEENVELIAVFSGEQWMDPTHYVTITTRRESADSTDCAEVEERVHLKKIVGQLKNNLCNVSVLSEADLEVLSNMDPNSLTDITGKDFMEQLKEASGRILYEKRQAFDAIELLKLFARHKGVSIDINQQITYGDQFDSDNISTTVMSKTFPSINSPSTSSSVDSSSLKHGINFDKNVSELINISNKVKVNNLNHNNNNNNKNNNNDNINNNHNSAAFDNKTEKI